MSKGSGGNRKSSSSKPAAMSQSTSKSGFALLASQYGISVSKSKLGMFEKAGNYANYQSAPQAFAKSFQDNSSQVILDIINKEDAKAIAIRQKKVSKAFANNDEKAYNAAIKEYESRMATVRNFTDMLRLVMDRFNKPR